MDHHMPVVFVGHGTPMNAVQDNEFTKALAAFGSAHPQPKAILCVSAHWVTAGTFITGSEDPEQIYDFYGFPPELYAVRYRPRGSRVFAKGTPFWALEFDRFVADALETGDDAALIAYPEKNRHAAVAVPTNEHYLPLLYACALRAPGDKVRYVYEGFQHGSISMRSFVISG